MTGLPKHYIEHAQGDLKRAWAAFRADNGGKEGKATARRSRETAAMDGEQLTTARGRGITVPVGAHSVVEYDAAALGAIWDGFNEAARESGGKVDTSEMFPWAAASSAAPDDVSRQAEWKRHAPHRALGRELFRSLGVAVAHFRITPAQWAQIFQRATMRARIDAGMVGGSNAGAGGTGGFAPPLSEPSAVTSPYGEARTGVPHRGVDLRAAEGSTVVSPTAGVVLEVDEEKEGGKFVKVGVQRPDGGYAGRASFADDSGIVLTFAHLRDQSVEVGQFVAAGDALGHSGNSGTHTTGPHLHVAAQLLDDGIFGDSVVYVDPTALWGGDAHLTGQDPEPRAPQVGDAWAALEYRQGGGEQSPQPLVVHVEHGGNVNVMRNGVAIGTVKTAIDVGGLWASGADSDQGGGGDTSLARDLENAARNGARQLRPLGKLATDLGGRALKTAFDPNTHATVLRVSAAGTSAVGAAWTGAGALASAASPWVAAIPYVGELVPAFAAVAGVAGPVFSFAGAAQNAASQLLRGIPSDPAAFNASLRQLQDAARNGVPSVTPGTGAPIPSSVDPSTGVVFT